VRNDLSLRAHGVLEVGMIALLPRGRRELAPPTMPKIMLTEHAYSFVDGNGETVHGAGYQLVGDDDGDTIFGFRDKDLEYAAYGVSTCSVVGVSYRHHEFQSDEFGPGCRLRLVPDPSNSYDGNAIEVRSSDGKLMAGFIPREIAAEIAPCFKRDGPWEAMSLWEWRTVSHGRIGIRVLMAPRLEVTGEVSQLDARHKGLAS
jgi:HIRAN domain